MAAIVLAGCGTQPALWAQCSRDDAGAGCAHGHACVAPGYCAPLCVEGDSCEVFGARAPGTRVYCTHPSPVVGACAAGDRGCEASGYGWVCQLGCNSDDDCARTRAGAACADGLCR